jgi:transcription antitermination factor NusG
VLAIHPGFEQFVTQRLRGKGIDVYVPKAPLPGKMNSEKSLFPGYLFCRLPIKEERTVSLTPGALGLLGTPSPTPCDDEDFSTLQKALCSGLPVKVLPFLQRNKQVRVAKGPLRGITGFILNRQGDRYFAIPIKAVKRTLAFKFRNWSIQCVHSLPQLKGPVPEERKGKRHRRSNLS